MNSGKRIASMAYKIDKRSSTTPTNEYSINFSDRDYSVPLCGCSNYTDGIVVGDIIGVKLSANQTVKTRFSTTSSLLSDEKVDLFSEKFGSYRPVEEHLFVVTKASKSSKFEVTPYFLLGDKVIAKQVEESFCSEWDIPVHEVDKFTLCEEMFVNKIFKQFSVPEEYGYFSPSKAKKLFTLLDSIDQSDLDSVQAKAIRKLFPLDNYATSLFHIPKESEHLREFYDNINKYEPLLRHYFGEECDTMLANFGTYELIVAHMDTMYEKALRIINGPTVKERVTHSLRIPSRLTVPTIHHKITTVKFNEIFRVYKPDPVYVLSKTKYVSNWGGVIVDKAIRHHFTTGNIVRVAFAKDKSVDQQSPYLYANVIYCRILQRLNESQHLACIENMYLSEYEDIVIVINSNAVSEVPFDWHGNENLVETNMDRDEGEGFGCTGTPAAAADEDNETYALNYDALFV